MVENSQVRMISNACGRRSIGNTRAKRSGSSSQPAASSGVSDEVAHVSITSGSATNPPALPRWSSVAPVGTSLVGSIGRRASSGTIGWS